MRTTFRALCCFVCLVNLVAVVAAQDRIAVSDAVAEPNNQSFVNRFFHAPVRLMVADTPLNNEAGQMYPSPAMFDVDNDGQIELVVGDIFGSLNVYENTNNGSGDPVWSSHSALRTADGTPIKVSNW